MITLKERNVIEITKDDLQRMRGSPRRDHHSKFMKEIKRANMMLMLPHITNVLAKRQTKNVAEEREAQIIYKQSIKEGWERQERKWLQSQQEEMEKLDKLEKIQAEKRRESVKALALDRLMQLKEHEERIKEKKRKKEDERKHLKQLQEEDRVFYEEKDKLKQQRIKEMNEEMVKANDAQKQLLASKVDTERSLARDQNQKKDEYDKKEALRIQRSKESLETCDKSRKMQLKWKHEQMMRDAAEERYEVERSSECVSRCKMEAENEEHERFLRNKAFADHQRNMAAYNKKKALEEALRDKEEEKAALQRMEDEEINEISLEDIKL